MKIQATISLCVLLACNAQAQPSGFTGYYAGAQLGVNHSKASSGTQDTTHTVGYPSLVAGHNFVKNGTLLGAEFFADMHTNSVTNKDVGVAFKMGKVWGPWAAYGRAGLTCCSPSGRPQLGAGVEYLINRQFSIVGQYTTDKDTSESTRYTNRSLSVGVNYHFR